MNLVKELQRTAKKNYENQLAKATQVLNSVKANLQMEDTEDVEILKYFGTQKVASSGNLKVDSIKNFIENEFVTEDDIKSVCLKYNLRFLRTEYYVKEVPLKVLNDIRAFKEANGITNSSMNYNLYIIAPKSHFKLGDRPKNDPVVLYKDGSVYRVISKWGNDFSFTRMVLSFFARYPNYIAASFIPVLSIFLGFFIHEDFFIGMFSMVAWLIVYMFNYFEPPFKSSEKNWDNPYRN